MGYFTETVFSATANTTDNSGIQTTATINTNFINCASCVITFTDAAAAGAFLMEATNVVNPASTDWITVPNTSQTVASGAATLIPKTELCYRHIRFKWTRSGGAGTMTATAQLWGVQP